MTLFTLYFILHTVHVALHNTARSVALNTAIMLMAAQVEGCSTGAMFSGLAWAMLTVNPTMGERGSQLFTEGARVEFQSVLQKWPLFNFSTLQSNSLLLHQGLRSCSDGESTCC